MTAEHGAGDPEVPEQLDDARDAGGAGGGTQSAMTGSGRAEEGSAPGLERDQRRLSPRAGIRRRRLVDLVVVIVVVRVRRDDL